MNICALSRITLTHAAKGGMEVHLKTLSEGLVRRGHQVKVITTAHPNGIEHEVQNGVEIYYCAGTEPGRYSEAWGKSSLALLAALHRKEPFDAVWGEGGGGYYYIFKARRRLGIPAMTFLQGSFLADMRSQLNEVRVNKNLALLFARHFPKRVYRYLTRDLIFAGRADAVIGSSRECARDARIEYFLGKDRIFASVNGIDVDYFRPLDCDRKEFREQHQLECGSQVIFTASRLIRGKGIHLLIAALPGMLKVVPNCVLLVAGTGPALQTLRTLARDLGLDRQINFLGYIPNHDLVRYYNCCDVFVYPTLLYESFGISVAEAMACGTAVIAASSGGIRTSIDHGINGFLYKPYRRGQLENLCIRALQDPRLRMRLGRQARQKAVACLSSERMITDVAEIFDLLISRRAAPVQKSCREHCRDRV